MMDQSHAKAVQEKEAKKRIELKMLAARLGGLGVPRRQGGESGRKAAADACENGLSCPE